jgi:hypothetical protein
MGSGFNNKFPFVAVPDAAHECAIGWDKIAAELQRAIARSHSEKAILVVDCYPGVDELAVLNALEFRLAPKLTIHAADACHSPERIDALAGPSLRGNNPLQRSNPLGAPKLPGVGGSTLQPFNASHPPGLSLVNFFNAEPLWRFRRTIDELKDGLVLIVGCGASLIAWGHILVYADLARREARQRFRRNETGNLGVHNRSAPANLKYKRAFFVDWPVTDRWKRPLIKRWDYALDTSNPGEPKLADAEDVRRGLQAAARRPFRLVPLFDPASSDGQDCEAKDFGGCFGCVLEENSLLLGFGDVRFEVPAIDLLFNQPHALLGEAFHARFGHEFPIRFDFLDAMNRFELLSSGDGWREERASLQERSFIESRRHWFSKTVAHDTRGGVNVLNLVEGDEAIVESPDGAFEPFIVHCAETFIVPAAVGRYNIRPHGPSAGKETATIKAFVRM